MIVLLNNVTISEELAHKAYLGENPICNFIFVHKNGKEITKRMNLTNAIFLAEMRRNDRRYKNYTYKIV